MASTTRTRILDGGLELWRTHQAVTLELAAEKAGVTKPGLMYHFATRRDLVEGLVDHVLDGYDVELTRRAGAAAEDLGPVQRLAAYARWALTSSFDLADLAALSDPRLRAVMLERWTDRMARWLWLPDELAPADRARLEAVRLIADGAWLESACHPGGPDRSARAQVLAVVEDLLAGVVA